MPSTGSCDALQVAFNGGVSCNTVTQTSGCSHPEQVLTCLAPVDASQCEGGIYSDQSSVH
jgi:hypothetical protein